MGCTSSSQASKETMQQNPAAGLGAFGAAYELDSAGKLGEGQFSVVRLATDRRSGRKVAVKCIKKAGLGEEDLLALVDEVTIMKKLRHDNLVQLIDFFSEAQYFYLVLELMEGGELFDRICKKTKYTEREARDSVRLLADAVAYMHAQGVVHRDLKPENILLSDDTDNAAVKIADFGFAKQPGAEAGGMALETACGTPAYVAPEILAGKRYGLEVDCWSLGVIFYILLCGYPPFHSEQQPELFRMIKKGEVEWDPDDWDHISAGARDLVAKLLVVDPRKRATAADILRHPWVVDGAVPDTDLSHTIAQMKRFNARRKLRGAMQAVRAVARTRIMIRAVTHAARESAAAEAEAEAGGAVQGAKAGGAGGAGGVTGDVPPAAAAPAPAADGVQANRV